MNSNVDNVIAVRCRGVTKTYGTGPAKVAALRGIDLDVHRGELVMLVARLRLFLLCRLSLNRMKVNAKYLAMI